MLKIIQFLLILFLYSSCIRSNKEAESICVDRCMTFEGIILDSATDEPLAGVEVRGTWDTPSFTISGSRLKARGFTDVNGYYHLDFEVFDEELERGHFELGIEKSEELFWPYGTIEVLELYEPEYDFDTTFTANFLIPRPAYVVYDINCLSDLLPEQVVELRLEYDLKTIDQVIKRSPKLTFERESEDDNGRLIVPANVPVKIVALRKDSLSEVVLNEQTLTLQFWKKEKFKVEI